MAMKPVKPRKMQGNIINRRKAASKPVPASKTPTRRKMQGNIIKRRTSQKTGW